MISVTPFTATNNVVNKRLCMVVQLIADVTLLRRDDDVVTLFAPTVEEPGDERGDDRHADAEQHDDEDAGDGLEAERLASASGLRVERVRARLRLPPPARKLHVNRLTIYTNVHSMRSTSVYDRHSRLARDDVKSIYAMKTS